MQSLHYTCIEVASVQMCVASEEHTGEVERLSLPATRTPDEPNLTKGTNRGRHQGLSGGDEADPE
jgi:hypothetical protein